MVLIRLWFAFLKDLLTILQHQENLHSTSESRHVLLSGLKGICRRQVYISCKIEVIKTVSLKLFCLSAPGGPPLNVSARNTSSTSINVTWQPIEERLQHGIILGHRINYIKQASLPKMARRKRRNVQDLEAEVLGENNITWVLEGLEKFTNYCIQVVGFNSKGDGNWSGSICVVTDEDSKCSNTFILKCIIHS